MPNFAVLTELNTLGKMDKFLYNNPELTFFRYSHMKTTNFALDTIMTHMDGNSRRRSAEIEREGDLAMSCYLVVDCPGITGQYAEKLGYAMIKSVSLNIGGQCIERLTGEYMCAWDELSGGLKRLSDAGANQLINPDDDGLATRLYVPLPFTFTQNSGSALPLIGLQHHAIKVEVELNNVGQIAPGTVQMAAYLSNQASAATAADTQAAAKWSDFDFHLMTCQVYLDKEERQSFADYSNDMLITQVQERIVDKSDLNRSFQLTFNHSINHLMWTMQGVAATKEGCSEVSLTFNNHERFHAMKQHGRYFRTVQPYMHHSNVPLKGASDRIYCYNFGLKPEDAQPSGSVNMSRIDNVHMKLSTDDDANNLTIRLYARNYNVLRIQNGMGGLVLTS